MENQSNTTEISKDELTKPGEEWVCLIGKNNVDVLVDKTKFQKNPGDIMSINGKQYIVISSHGDRNCMIAVGNHHIKSYNQGKRFDYWTKK